MPCKALTYVVNGSITKSYRQFREAEVSNTIAPVETTCISYGIQRVLLVRITFPSIGLTEGIVEGVTNGIHVRRINRTVTLELSRVLEVDALRAQRRSRYFSIVNTIGTVLPCNSSYVLQCIVIVRSVLRFKPCCNGAQVEYFTFLDRQLRSEVI